MKNKKISYLLTTILTLFSFNLSVNAAQELTCIYHKQELFGWYMPNADKVILIQKNDGSQIIYTNQLDVSIDGANWTKTDYGVYQIIDGTETAVNTAYDACPDKALLGEKKVTFITLGHWTQDVSTWVTGYQNLEDQRDYVVYLESVKSTTPNNVANYETDMLVDLETINLPVQKLDHPEIYKYTGACKYKKMTSDGRIHYIQINFGKRDMLITEYDSRKGRYTGVAYYEDVTQGQSGIFYIDEYKFEISDAFNVDYFNNNKGGECLTAIRVHRSKNFKTLETVGSLGTNQVWSYETKIHTYDEANNSTETYTLYDVAGYNPINGKKLTIDGIETPLIVPNVDVENCAELLGEDIAGYFSLIWKLVKIAIPILLIGLGTIDFVQAIFAGKEDGMKKAQEKFMKRIIIAIIIFIIPFVLELLLDMANNVWDLGTDICGIIF